MLKSIGPQSYRIDLPSSFNIHNVFHISLLTRHRGASMVERLEEPQHPLEEVWNEEHGSKEQEWEVEGIIASRIHRRKLQYRVR